MEKPAFTIFTKIHFVLGKKCITVKILISKNIKLEKLN